MARQQWDLSDRVALVTGGARGIGWQVCRRLAARGATVAVLDIAAAEAAAQAAELGERHTGLGCDVSDPGLVTDAVSKIVDRYGRLDVVVANAGVPPPPTTVLAVDPAEFERGCGSTCTVSGTPCMPACRTSSPVRDTYFSSRRSTPTSTGSSPPPMR